MITTELLRAIRNDLPMRLTIVRLGRFGPIAKQSDGYFRFECPSCSELRATVNPKNNLAHCFCCGENFNNIDLLMVQGHEFLPAVDIFKNWLLDRETTWPALSNRKVPSLSRFSINSAKTPEKGPNSLQSQFGQNYDNKSARNSYHSQNRSRESSPRGIESR